MKIGFTGTRKGMTHEQRRAVEDLIAGSGISEAHHGDCIGADRDFHHIVRHFVCRLVGHPCTIETARAFCDVDENEPPLDPLSRNRVIVARCQWLIACPKGFEEELRSGTWATVRYAKKQGKRVTIVWPDGGQRTYPAKKS